MQKEKVQRIHDVDTDCQLNGKVIVAKVITVVIFLVSIRVQAFFWKMNSAIFVLHFSQKNGWPWEGPPTESRFVAAWAHL